MDTEETRKAEERLHEADLFIAAAEELRKNPAWNRFEKLLKEKLKSHRDAHEDPRKHPLRRSEHLWAVKELDILNGWLEAETEKARKIARRSCEKLDL